VRDEPKDSRGAGLDRRTLIKAAAVAGVGAWTAPAIIGSIASPAAAASGGGVACGDYSYVFLVTYDSESGCTAVLQPTSCTPTGFCLTNQVGPGDPGDNFVTPTFVNACAEEDGGGVNQGICWATSQGLFTNMGFGPSGVCTDSTYGCFNVNSGTCSDTSNAQDPNDSTTVPQGTQYLINLVVNIPCA
jgi:hypothetical protein